MRRPSISRLTLLLSIVGTALPAAGPGTPPSEPGRSGFTAEAVTQPSSFSGDRNESELSRRAFLQAAAFGGASGLLGPLSASAAASWPAVPPWTIAPPLEPSVLPADIEAQMDKRIAEAGAIDPAIQQAIAGIAGDRSPEEREKEFIAAVLLCLRAGRLDRLAPLLDGPAAGFLWNRRELLDRIYEASWGDTYRRFRDTFGYHPVSITDRLWLGRLLPAAEERGLWTAAPLWKRLTEAGCHFSFEYAWMAADWARGSAAEQEALVTLAAALPKEFLGDRLRTEEAMRSLAALAQPAGSQALARLREPGASDFARRIDRLTEGQVTPLDVLIELLPLRGTPGMELVLNEPARFGEALPGGRVLSPANVRALAALAEDAPAMTTVRALEDRFGYQLSLRDAPLLKDRSSGSDLAASAGRAAELFGGLPPLNTAGLLAVVRLQDLPDPNRAMLRRVFVDLYGGRSVPRSGEILRAWVEWAAQWPQSLQRASMTEDDFWRRVGRLRDQGWQPGAEPAPARLAAPETPANSIVPAKSAAPEFAPQFRDEHLGRLFQDQRLQAFVRSLIGRGYVWDPADAEFLYHLERLARSDRAWARRLTALPVTPDLFPLKRAYLLDQLGRPALREQVRRLVEDDLRDRYSEWGGILAFDRDGSLRFVPLPSRYEPLQDTRYNGGYDLRYFDEQNMRWYAGRFFAFFHMHALPDVDLPPRESPSDMAATSRRMNGVVGLNLVIAAAGGDPGSIAIGAFTARSADLNAARFPLRLRRPAIRRFLDRLDRFFGGGTPSRPAASRYAGSAA